MRRWGETQECKKWPKRQRDETQVWREQAPKRKWDEWDETQG